MIKFVDFARIPVIHDDQSLKVHGFICRYFQIRWWVGGSEPILTLFEFKNPYGKMDCPLHACYKLAWHVRF